MRRDRREQTAFKDSRRSAKTVISGPARSANGDEPTTPEGTHIQQENPFVNKPTGRKKKKKKREAVLVQKLPAPSTRGRHPRSRRLTGLPRSSAALFPSHVTQVHSRKETGYNHWRRRASKIVCTSLLIQCTLNQQIEEGKKEKKKKTRDR